MTRADSSELLLRFSMARDRFVIKVDVALVLSEPVAIFGPSGSGKTSILRAIAGLDRANEGSIRLGDQVWQDGELFVPPWRRNVGYVFQDARLFSHLDVNGNLDLALRYANSHERIGKAEVIDKLNVGTLLDRDTSSLSGGETQRVAIARTLLTQPQILLMDEPVSSLDGPARVDTIEYISAVTKEFGVPLIYVTHDAGEVARLASTTMLLDNGEVKAIGPTPEVFAEARPGFIETQTASIVVATVKAEANGLQEMSIGKQRLRLPMQGRSVGEQLQLRIFATDVVLARRRIEETSIRNVLQGTIENIESCGTGTAEVRVGIDGQILKAHVTDSAVAELSLSAGETVYAMIKSVALGDPRQERIS
jgi:molybdate transport system ATP-binding protein